ncbi:U-box domain-containing protein 45-like isoform X3 [Tasmannia lanceolata]
MGKDVVEVEQEVPYPYDVKVHSLMCGELTKFVNRITDVFPAIESARPGCRSGIKALCSLNVAIEKAKLLLRHCVESSKLYLAITGESILLRFERAQKTLDLSLSQIQNMLPPPLASQISEIANDLRDAKFIMESSEQEAGRRLLELLKLDKFATDSTENSEFEAFHVAALRLNITSPKALLIEKRSIRKLLDKVHDTDQRTESILKYLLYLVGKYGKFVRCESTENVDGHYNGPLSISNSACTSGVCENPDESVDPKLHMDYSRCEAQSDMCSLHVPPEEFRVPISSKSMFDPMVVPSRQTYDSHGSQYFVDFKHEIYLNFLSKLVVLPLDSPHKAVEGVKLFMKDNDEACHAMLSNGFMEALMRFLKYALDLSSKKAQKTGAQILLAFFSNSRNGIPALHEDAFHLLGTFLDSEISKEAMVILQMLSSHRCCKPKIVASGALYSIIKIIDSQVGELLVHAVKILYDLSSHSGIRPHLVCSGCISKLVPLLGDGELSGTCIMILENLCDVEGARVAIAETNGCIASIVELLDTGSDDEQEHAVAILLSLCSQSFDCCQSVMREGVIPSLVIMSVNGNSRAKESGLKLLLLLRDLEHTNPPDSLHLQVRSTSELSLDSGRIHKEKQTSSKGSGFFKRKMSIFSKPKRI